MTRLALSALALCSLPAIAQPARPDAGTLLEQQRPVPSLPAPGGAATTVLPPAPPPAAFDNAVRVLPTGFRIQGNTLFSDAELQATVAAFAGRPTDMAGLLAAAAAVRGHYRDRGYLLTEAYLPQQAFAAAGGTVTIQVLEARVGRVTVRVEGEGVSRTLASGIVEGHLRSGDAITAYALDKPILLLRDQAGFDATATVEPGQGVGEADVTVVVRPSGPRAHGSVGADNAGVRAAGAYRFWADANLNNLAGRGDVLSARVQASDQRDSHLWRLGYAIALGGQGARLGLSAVRTEYALGRQFAALGAAGEATVLGLSMTQPFIRSRAANLVGAITLERKELDDSTTAPASSAGRRVDAVRLGLMGNFVDGHGSGAFNTYGIHLTRGQVELDAASRAVDQSASGLRTAGGFSKLHLEYGRTMDLGAASRVVMNLQGQLASKNLTSAEKIGLGGIDGVRGHPAGQAVGDQGAILQLELQQRLPQAFGIPLTGSVFFDIGHVRYDVDAPLRSTGRGSDTLHALGVGLAAGSFGDWLLHTQLAWRTDSQRPAGDADQRPRLWLSVQKWL